MVSAARTFIEGIALSGSTGSRAMVRLGALGHGIGQRRARASVARAAGRPRTVTAFLEFLFSWLALKLALVLPYALVVTAPAAIVASVGALDSRRGAGEDRVVRSFLANLRVQATAAGTLRAGVPLVVLLGALEEMHDFSAAPMGVGWLCLGLAAAALVVASSAATCCFVVGLRYPGAPALDPWQLCLRLSLRNLLNAAPLLAIAGAVFVLLVLADPAFARLGLPPCWVLWSAPRSVMDCAGPVGNQNGSCRARRRRDRVDRAEPPRALRRALTIQGVRRRFVLPVRRRNGSVHRSSERPVDSFYGDSFFRGP